MSEIRFGCFGKLVVKKMKDMMENNTGGREPIIWCG
jgi:hypothetical protein